MVQQRKLGFGNAFLEEVEFWLSGTNMGEVSRKAKGIAVDVNKNGPSTTGHKDMVNKLVCGWAFIGADAKGNTNFSHYILVLLFTEPTLSSFKADYWTGHEAPVL